MRIAHLSDLHILDVKGIRPGRFLNRRLAGGANILVSRREGHSTDLFERLLEDIIVQAPDHTVLTGDLSNLALESEFDRAAAYLRMVWSPANLTVVPGNHDHYTLGAIRSRRFEKVFHPYMFQEFSDLDVGVYPFVRHLGDVALFGLCSPVKTIPPFSYGEVGPAQLSRLVQQLREPQYATAFKVVLLHHHLHETRSRSARWGGLRRREDFARAALENGVDLILHGHDHTAHVGFLENGEHRIPVVGVGSATATDPRPHKTARYNIYTIEDGKLVDTEVRRWDPQGRAFRVVL